MSYGFLLYPPDVSFARDGHVRSPWRIDKDRLYVQWIMVGVVTGGLMLTFRQTKETKLPAEPGK
jgi:hypothetical protein